MTIADPILETKMQIKIVWTCSLLSVVWLCGCGDSPKETTSPEPAPKTTGTEAPETTGNQPGSGAAPSEQETITFLEELGAKVRKNDKGAVFSLDGNGSQITDADVDELQTLSSLKYVNLAETEVTDDGLKSIATIPNLTLLDLRECSISNVGIEHLKGNPTLKALILASKTGNTTVDGGAMPTIGTLKELKILGLDFLWVGSKEEMEHLKDLTHLEQLNMAKTFIDDDALVTLTNFPNLKTIRLNQCPYVSDIGLEHLLKLEKLTDLDLSENSVITDAGMQHVGAMQQLTKLNLWRVPITDSGVEHLASLTNLTWLNLDNTQLTDAGLPHLAGMKNLEFLHLGSTLVTDAGLEHLETLTTLKDLKVTRTAVTADGIAKLKEKLPETEIQLEYLNKDEEP